MTEDTTSFKTSANAHAVSIITDSDGGLLINPLDISGAHIDYYEKGNSTATRVVACAADGAKVALRTPSFQLPHSKVKKGNIIVVDRENS